MTKTIALSLVIAASLGLSACSKEEAENNMDAVANMSDNAMDAADNAMDAAMNSADNAMDAAGNATENVANAM